jgi:hypothetical protein
MTVELDSVGHDWPAFREEYRRAANMLRRSCEAIYFAKELIEAEPSSWWHSSILLACDLAAQLNNAALEQVGRMAYIDPDNIPF